MSDNDKDYPYDNSKWGTMDPTLKTVIETWPYLSWWQKLYIWFLVDWYIFKVKARKFLNYIGW